MPAAQVTCVLENVTKRFRLCVGRVSRGEKVARDCERKRKPLLYCHRNPHKNQTQSMELESICLCVEIAFTWQSGDADELDRHRKGVGKLYWNPLDLIAYLIYALARVCTQRVLARNVILFWTGPLDWIVSARVAHLGHRYRL